MRKNAIVFMLILLSPLLLSSQVFAGTISFSWGSGQQSDSGQTVTKAQDNSPPAHAPAHGYRSKHAYRYYPSASVYQDNDTGLYFYLSGSGWQVAASLPQDLSVRLGSFVSMELDTDKPYIYNDQHRKQYPPGQLKKMDKGKGKKSAKG